VNGFNHNSLVRAVQKYCEDRTIAGKEKEQHWLATLERLFAPVEQSFVVLRGQTVMTQGITGTDQYRTGCSMDWP
jgi:hypothetical protein